MTRPAIILWLAFFACVVTVTSSCRKNSVANPAEIVEGRWKLIQYAFDNSNTGIIENDEILNQPHNLVTVLDFNKDGSGVLISGSTSSYNGDTFVWTINGHDSLKLEYAAHDTITYYLLAGNSSNLILTTRTNSPVLLWYKFAKQ